jgi:hypothetical protein
VITIINRDMLVRAWEELEFRLHVLRMTHGVHTEVHWEYIKSIYVSIK